jgi:hypothetical protein
LALQEERAFRSAFRPESYAFARAKDNGRIKERSDRATPATKPVCQELKTFAWIAWRTMSRIGSA